MLPDLGESLPGIAMSVACHVWLTAPATALAVLMTLRHG
jgi:hypothetical protein